MSGVRSRREDHRERCWDEPGPEWDLHEVRRCPHGVIQRVEAVHPLWAARRWFDLRALDRPILWWRARRVVRDQVFDRPAPLPPPGFRGHRWVDTPRKPRPAPRPPTPDRKARP